ncbi:MAG: hypothetical protein VX367_06355 [SAR324 cluster bacterium]|nr:hypothetical protein [SAR324 cluster bacterium]
MHISRVPADLEGFLLLQRKVPADYMGSCYTGKVPAVIEGFLLHVNLSQALKVPAVFK